MYMISIKLPNDRVLAILKQELGAYFIARYNNESYNALCKLNSFDLNTTKSYDAKIKQMELKGDEDFIMYFSEKEVDENTGVEFITLDLGKYTDAMDKDTIKYLNYLLNSLYAFEDSCAMSVQGSYDVGIKQN